MYLFDFFRLVPKQRKVKIRRKNGVIFNNPGGVKRYIFYISNLLILTGLVLVFYIYYPVTKALVDFRSYQSNISNGKATSITNDKSTNILVSDDKFMIFIPKILAEAKIVKNVSPSDKDSFDSILKNGSVAMTTGSDMPGSGMGSSMFIFSHSTTQNIFGARSNAVFYLLGELVEGDQIYIYNEGKKYVYEVYKSEIVSANETNYLDYHEEDCEILILQTCWPLGTNWKRLLIFAKRVDAMI